MTGLAFFNHCADVWHAFMLNRITESTLVLIAVSVIWFSIRTRVSPKIGCWLFFLPILKLVLIVPVTLPNFGGDWGTPAAIAENISPLLLPAQLSPPIKSSITESTSTIDGTPTDSPRTHEIVAGESSSNFELPTIPMATFAFALWCLIAVVLLIRYAAAQYSTARHVRRCRSYDLSSLPIDFNDLQRTAGIKRSIRVAVSPTIAAPVVWGIFKPCLLLPVNFAESYSRNQMKWILLHELAHIRGNDLIVSMFQRFMRILFFFHPVVWVCDRMLNQLREYACDDFALANCGGSRTDCGEGFLAVVEVLWCKTNPLKAPLGIMIDKNHVRRRMMRILDEKRAVTTGLSFYSFLFLIAITLLTLPTVQAVDPDAPSTLEANAGVESQSTSEMANAKTDSTPSAANTLSGALTIRKITKEQYIEIYFTKIKTDDGEYVVETDWDTGNLVVREIATGKKRNLTNKGTWDDSDDFAEECQISQEDRIIAFVWYNSKTERHELRCIDFDGANEEVLIRDEDVNYVGDIQWVADGKKIFACLGTQTEYKFVVVSPRERTTEILTTTVRTPESSAHGVAPSPDGSRFVYGKPGADNNNDLYLYDISSRSEIAFVQHPANDQAVGWSADGKWFFFVSDRLVIPSLWGLQMSSYKEQIAPVLIHQFPGNISLNSFALSKNNILTYHEWMDIQETYRVELDIDTGQFLNTPKLLHTSYRKTREDGVNIPLMIGDGKMAEARGVWGRFIHKPLAKDANGIETYSAELKMESEPTKPISSKFYSFGGGEWSRDGRYLLCNYRVGLPHTQGLRNEIYLLDYGRGTSDPSQVQFELIVKDVHSVLGYADGEKTFYYAAKENDSGLKSIVERSFDSGKERVVYSAPANMIRNLYPKSISYDKNWVVYFDPTENCIRRVELKNGESRVLRKYGQNEPEFSPSFLSLCWTLDNQHVLYLTHNRRGSRTTTTMWKLSKEGGEPQKVRYFPEEVDYFHFETGNQLFISVLNKRSIAWLMENFIPEEIPMADLTSTP